MNIEVERKLPTDAAYKTISMLTPTNSFAATSFAIEDDLNDLQSDIAIKYRIKMSIAADTSFYLDSVTVNYTKSCRETISVRPNPVTDNLSVLIVRNISVNAAIEIYSVSGQKIYSLLNQTVSGTKTFSIPTKHLNAGIYFVAIFIDNKKVTTKKIIVR
jgi:hypothetical protein